MADLEVIAWDGEGFDENGRHRYAELACAYGGPNYAAERIDADITRGPELRRREGLRCFQMLDLIHRMGASYPQALNVMYGASYDWDHWIREVDMPTAQALAGGHPVVVGGFTLRSNGVWFEVGKGHRTTQIWDLWKFWGQGFEPALRDTFPKFHGLEVIRQFKETRGRFTWDMMDEVAHYNRLELEALIMLTRQLFLDLGEADIPAPAYLTGAGSLAGALFRKYGFRHHRGDPHFGDPRVEDAVLRAFSAGRIDPWQVGHVPPASVDGKAQTTVYQHDLVSAYPTAMCELPSMGEGEWKWVDGEPTGTWEERMSTWLIRWNYVPGVENGKFDVPPTRRYYPFFYRTRQGNILYPPAGAGWQMWPEVVVARALGWRFSVVGGWVWYPADPDARPLSWVPMLFARRAELKAQGRTGAQRVLKYGLNSLYGKMCQSRGATYDKPPANQNLAMAAWVTSHCRAKIMEAAHQAPDSVLFQMTDSVVSLDQLDVPVGKALGFWEVEERTRAVIAQAGVGSTWDTRGREWKKYRGFDPEVITSDAILAAWEENHALGWAHPLECVTRRPVTLAQAVLSADAFEEFGNWVDQPRQLHLYGGDGKRIARDWEAMRPWEGPCPLEPAPAYAVDGVPLSLAEMEEFCLERGLDVLSSPYEPRYSTSDPWSLPEVAGRWRQREREAEDA